MKPDTAGAINPMTKQIVRAAGVGQPYERHSEGQGAEAAADHSKYCLGTAIHEAVETEYKG